jgi:hypothetical protein
LALDSARQHQASAAGAAGQAARWISERDYQELKQELGLGHYEGRGWRGFHHHATLGIAAYGLLVAERSRFSPRLAPVKWTYPLPKHRRTSALGLALWA